MIKTIVAAGLLWIVSSTGAEGQEYKSGDGSRLTEQHREHANAKDQPARQQKWKLDESTRANIAGIRNLLTGPATGKDLGQLGNALQKQTDRLVRECRMEGPDHDALHVWLEHYLGHLKQMKDPSGDRLKAYRELQEDIIELDKKFQ